MKGALKANTQVDIILYYTSFIKVVWLHFQSNMRFRSKEAKSSVSKLKVQGNYFMLRGTIHDTCDNVYAKYKQHA